MNPYICRISLSMRIRARIDGEEIEPDQSETGEVVSDAKALNNETHGSNQGLFYFASILISIRRRPY